MCTNILPLSMPGIDPFDLYCGAKKVPKGKTLGTARQCYENSRVGYWGLHQVPDIVAKNVNEEKKSSKKYGKPLWQLDDKVASLKRLIGYTGIAILRKTKELERTKPDRTADIKEINEFIKLREKEIDNYRKEIPMYKMKVIQRIKRIEEEEKELAKAASKAASKKAAKKNRK